MSISTAMRHKNCRSPSWTSVKVDKEKTMTNNRDCENVKDVLIMEGDHDITHSYSKALTRLGYSFDVARTMDQARACLNQNTYRTFICAVQKGNGHRIDRLPEYQETFAGHGTKVVMASAYRNYSSRNIRQLRRKQHD